MPQSDKFENRAGGGIAFAAILCLICLTVVYRLAASHLAVPQNSAPLMATAFGGAFLLGFRFWWLPVVALLLSDILLALSHGGEWIGGYTFLSAAFYVVVAIFACRSGRTGTSWLKLWGGTLLCSIGFYVAANTYSWLALPYEKSLAGWWQSQTLGDPNYSPPAWVFLRNALIGDSIWCSFAGLALFAAERRESGSAVTEAS